MRPFGGAPPMALRYYFYRCDNGHEYYIRGPESPWEEGPDVTACPECGSQQSWHRSTHKLDAGHGNRNLLHQPGEQSEDKAEQAFLNVKNHMRDAGEGNLRSAEQFTEKEAAGMNERRRMAEEKDRSMHRRDGGDMRMVGEVPLRLHRKMIRESGDPHYWSRDNGAALKRHGLWYGRR